MKPEVFSNKRYEKVDLTTDSSVFSGYVGDYSVCPDVYRKLSRELGFSYELYSTLSNIDTKSSDALVSSMSTQSNHEEVVLLFNDDTKEVINFSLDADRTPVLNSEFINRAYSMSETCDEVSISEVYYHKDSTVASVIFKKKSPIIVEEQYENQPSKFIEYDIGLLIMNDESTTTSSRLVLYSDGQPLYLPATYYNVTASRYKRSTSNSAEALEVLLLRAIDDLREDAMKPKIYEVHYQYRSNKNILASYEEYNTILRTMRKVPTIIEDPSVLELLLSKYETFEAKYAGVDDQKSSYIWRCTALGDTTLGSLLAITTKIMKDVSAPPIEYYGIRELLGSYISTNRIAEEIAKEII